MVLFVFLRGANIQHKTKDFRLLKFQKVSLYVAIVKNEVLH